MNPTAPASTKTVINLILVSMSMTAEFTLRLTSPRFPFMRFLLYARANTNRSKSTGYISYIL